MIRTVATVIGLLIVTGVVFFLTREYFSAETASVPSVDSPTLITVSSTPQYQFLVTDTESVFTSDGATRNSYYSIQKVTVFDDWSTTTVAEVTGEYVRHVAQFTRNGEPYYYYLQATHTFPPPQNNNNFFVPGTFRIVERNLRTGSERVVADIPNLLDPRGIVTTSDGSHILVQSTSDDAVPDPTFLRYMDFSDWDIHLISELGEQTKIGRGVSPVFMPDGESFLYVTENGYMQYSLATGISKLVLAPQEPHHHPLINLAVSDDGTYLAISNYASYNVKVFEVVRPDIFLVEQVNRISFDYDHRPQSLSFSPDGKLLIIDVLHYVGAAPLRTVELMLVPTLFTDKNFFGPNESAKIVYRLTQPSWYFTPQVQWIR
jgi:hypothetical protein